MRYTKTNATSLYILLFTLRPILSAVTCHNYKLAKFLVPLLQPLTVSPNTITDIFSFNKELQDRIDSNTSMMVSCDIESLFTNVPVKETIDIILNKLFSNTKIYEGFTRSDFQSLLELAVGDSFFSFNNNLYKQTDGLAMGSPLGPIFANIFLNHIEELWFQFLPFQPFLYKRYVDDTLWILPENSDIPALVTCLNSMHPNLKFTCETEKFQTIPFLGMQINRNSDS